MLLMLISGTFFTPSADLLLGALLGFRKAMISYLQDRNAPYKQILDLNSVQQLYDLLMRALSHEVHNVVSASLEALQQLLKVAWKGC